MNIKDTRYAHFTALLARFEKDVDFLAKVNKALEKHPEYSDGISPSQLSQLKSRTRNVGPATARKLEIAFRMEPYSFDSPIAGDGELDNEFEALAASRTPAQRRKAIREIAAEVSPEDALRFARIFLDRVETGL